MMIGSGVSLPNGKLENRQRSRCLIIVTLELDDDYGRVGHVHVEAHGDRAKRRCGGGIGKEVEAKRIAGLLLAPTLTLLSESAS